MCDHDPASPCEPEGNVGQLAWRQLSLWPRGLCRALDARWLQPVQIVGCLLGMGGGVEDRPLVVLQDGQPVGDIGSVVLPQLQRQLQVGTEERRAELGNEFFLRITLIAPPRAAEVPVEA